MNLIVANWKSNKQVAEVAGWWQDFQNNLPLLSSDLEIVIAPPFPLLVTVSEFVSTAELPVCLAVQDLSPFPAGAYTGAVSTENIHSLGVQYAIVGHSERRRYFHETHQEVANKVDQALAASLTPIVCVDKDYIQAQAAAIPDEQKAKCWVAYEPLAAIGSGQEEPVEQVAPVVEEIQKHFQPLGVLYGGSVGVTSVRGYLEICQGVLVGTSSLKDTEFAALVTAADRE